MVIMKRIDAEISPQFSRTHRIVEVVHVAYVFWPNAGKKDGSVLSSSMYLNAQN